MIVPKQYPPLRPAHQPPARAASGHLAPSPDNFVRHVKPNIPQDFTINNPEHD